MKIVNGLVFDNDTFIKKNIYIKGDRITDEATYDEEVIDADGLYVLPGLIDIHLHGAMGKDVCDGKSLSIRDIAEYNASNGVLAICPTTMTIAKDELLKACEAVAEYSYGDGKDGKGSEIIGINLEGPFISPKRPGAQNINYITSPDMTFYRKLQETAKGLIKIVNIAPELDGAMDFIEEQADNISISIAHTDCSYEVAKNAFKNGASQITHLYNAMPGINHRMPGPVIAAYEEDAYITLICDGIHIHPAIVRFTFDVFAKDKIILISDSMEATGLSDGRYQLGGQSVIKQGNRVQLENDDSVIAGSASNLFQCMKEAVNNMNIPMTDAVRAATVNPAKAIGIYDEYGSIDCGKYANIVITDKYLNIVRIIKRGIEL